jgi:alpha-galactosidase
MARSPLILGANLTKLDEWTTRLITNRDVLNVNQSGHDQSQVEREGDTVAWTSSGKGDIRYLALFNLNDQETTIRRSYDFYNLPAKTYQSRELWTQTNRGTSNTINVVLPPHGCVLLELKP